MRVFTQSCDVQWLFIPTGHAILQFMKCCEAMPYLQSAHCATASTSRPRINELSVPARIGKPESWARDEQCCARQLCYDGPGASLTSIFFSKSIDCVAICYCFDRTISTHA